jgi:hypothetical protein
MSAPTVSNGLDGLAEGPEGDTPMSFWDHLGELRSRLTRAALGVTVSVVLCFIYATELREFLAVPLHKAWIAANMPGKPELQVLAMMDAFMTDMRVAFAGGIFLALPVLFYQFWMFIAPGLYAREKRFVIPFVACSVFMFLLGAAFCYYVVLPWTIQWLLSYTQSHQRGRHRRRLQPHPQRLHPRRHQDPGRLRRRVRVPAADRLPRLRRDPHPPQPAALLEDLGRDDLHHRRLPDPARAGQPADDGLPDGRPVLHQRSASPT